MGLAAAGFGFTGGGGGGAFFAAANPPTGEATAGVYAGGGAPPKEGGGGGGDFLEAREPNRLALLVADVTVAERDGGTPRDDPEPEVAVEAARLRPDPLNPVPARRTAENI